MSEGEWLKFFMLIDKISNLERMSWQEKRDLVLEKARENNCSSFDEFTNWFAGE